MTGIEGAAAAGAGKAVVKLAGKALEEDPKEKDVLRDIAEKSGALEPAAMLYAKRAAVKQLVMLKLWQPFALMVGASRDYFDNQFADDMADRMADVPAEDVVTPKGSIAGPAFQGLGFSVDEPQLREMYLKLLATASDKRVESSAHPSFAEVIRQLSADEANTLGSVLALDAHPIVEIRLAVEPTALGNQRGYSTLATHVLNWMTVKTNDGAQEVVQVGAPERAMFVDNWIRLGLVTVDYVNQLMDQTRYGLFQTAPLVLAARKQYDSDNQTRVTIQHGVLTVTSFGRAFEKAVIGARASLLAAQKPTVGLDSTLSAETPNVEPDADPR